VTDGPRLVEPPQRAAASFRAALDEYRAEGRLGVADDSALAATLRRIGELRGDWFASYLVALRAELTTPRPGLVPQTTLWWVDGEEFLGRLSLRHHLTPQLRRHGGHIGYDVRPSARRRGHATAMLRAALPIAAGLGINPALLTCDPANVASRKVIEACGGARDGGAGPQLRFWVPTGRTDGR
jgi:predicted acetyltransferase